jgi:hypothetical protein
LVAILSGQETIHDFIAFLRTIIDVTWW